MFMTATPKITSVNDNMEIHEIVSMSNPSKFGDVFYEMTFGKAIEQNILVDYDLIVSGIDYTDDDMENGKVSLNEIVKNQSLQDIANAYNARHIISFHSSIKKAEDFANRHNEKFKNEDNYNINTISCKIPTIKRSKILKEFSKSKKGLISNSKCLTEGVDIPAIDMVFFADTKNSTVDIIQASGRALRVDKNNPDKKGVIAIPLFHYKGQNPRHQANKSKYKNIVEVVCSLSDIDQRLRIDSTPAKKISNCLDKIKFTDNVDTNDKIKMLEQLLPEIETTYLFREAIDPNKYNFEYFFDQLMQCVNKMESGDSASQKSLDIYTRMNIILKRNIVENIQINDNEDLYFIYLFKESVDWLDSQKKHYDSNSLSDSKKLIIEKLTSDVCPDFCKFIFANSKLHMSIMNLDQDMIVKLLKKITFVNYDIIDDKILKALSKYANEIFNKVYDNQFDLVDFNLIILKIKKEQGQQFVKKYLKHFSQQNPNLSFLYDYQSFITIDDLYLITNYYKCNTKVTTIEIKKFLLKITNTNTKTTTSDDYIDIIVKNKKIISILKKYYENKDIIPKINLSQLSNSIKNVLADF